MITKAKRDRLPYYNFNPLMMNFNRMSIMLAKDTPQEPTYLSLKISN